MFTLNMIIRSQIHSFSNEKSYNMFNFWIYYKISYKPRNLSGRIKQFSCVCKKLEFMKPTTSLGGTDVVWDNDFQFDKNHENDQIDTSTSQIITFLKQKFSFKNVFFVFKNFDQSKIWKTFAGLFTLYCTVRSCWPVYVINNCPKQSLSPSSPIVPVLPPLSPNIFPILSPWIVPFVPLIVVPMFLQPGCPVAKYLYTYCPHEFPPITP